MTRDSYDYAVDNPNYLDEYANSVLDDFYASGRYANPASPAYDISKYWGSGLSKTLVSTDDIDLHIGDEVFDLIAGAIASDDIAQGIGITRAPGQLWEVGDMVGYNGKLYLYKKSRKGTNWHEVASDSDNVSNAYDAYMHAMGYDDGYFVNAYDNGGILSGTGGIKATMRPETVNDPDLTSKILSPISNKEFDTYVRDIGILFGAAKQYAANGVATTNNNGGTTNNNGNTYVINGITIPEEVGANYSIVDLVEYMSLRGN